MKKQISILLVVLIVIVIGAAVFSQFQKKKLFTVMPVPSFALTDENGHSITNKDLLGKVYVVEFFFTNCPTICPIMNQNISAINDSINSPNFGAISITIDPERDTPERLKLHKKRLEINNPNWHFLTGNRDSIYAVSQAFNIYIGKNIDTEEGLNHSGKFALVDKKGFIRSRYDQNGLPILYYSGLNYTDKNGQKADLAGRYHPQINWLKEDIKKLLTE